jgi:drug/metabolite transporter (DMT)-like permease
VLLGFCAALAAAVLFGSASIVQATAVRRIPRSAGLSTRLVVELLGQPLFLIAMAMNLVGFSLHLVALRSIPLFLAQAGIAASLAVTALLAVRVHDDQLERADWAAVAGTCIGLALLAASSGTVGDETASHTFTIGLYAALAVLTTGGFLASRMQGALSTELLGLLAGFGFAGVSVSARVLPGLAPATVVAAPSAYALAISGALAFLLYSVALQRGSVTGATAPMIVSQTVTPAAVGVLLLHDGIRPGWIPIAAIGFVVTGLGALQLARFEQTVERAA